MHRFVPLAYKNMTEWSSISAVDANFVVKNIHHGFSSCIILYKVDRRVCMKNDRVATIGNVDGRTTVNGTNEKKLSRFEES